MVVKLLYHNMHDMANHSFSPMNSTAISSGSLSHALRTGAWCNVGAHLRTTVAGIEPRFSCESLEPRFVPIGNLRAPAVPDFDGVHPGRTAFLPAPIAYLVNSLRPAFHCRKQPAACGVVVLDLRGQEEVGFRSLHQNSFQEGDHGLHVGVVNRSGACHPAPARPLSLSNRECAEIQGGPQESQRTAPLSFGKCR